MPGWREIAEVDGRRPVVPAGVPRVFDAVVDVGDFAQAHRAAVAVGHRNRAVLVGRHELPARLHDEVALRSVERARRPVHVGAGDGLRDLVDANLPRGQLRRVDVDADGEFLGAEDVDAGHAAHHGQPLR